MAAPGVGRAEVAAVGEFDLVAAGPAAAMSASRIALGSGHGIYADCSISISADLAPKFYPVLSSPLPLDLPCWAVEATGAGAEPSA